MITNSIFILGAGSSAEYGMPLWDELAKEMRNSMSEKIADSAKYEVEINAMTKIFGVNRNHILTAHFFNACMMTKVAKGQYKTIDQCLSEELEQLSRRPDMLAGFDHSNVQVVEHWFWLIMLHIFKGRLSNKCSSSNSSTMDLFLRSGNFQTTGWIKELFSSDVNSGMQGVHSNAYVDFNYDDIFRSVLRYLIVSPRYYALKDRRVRARIDRDAKTIDMFRRYK